MTDLSPAAQAVLDAANNSSAYGPEDCLNEARQIAAAALRAAVDQVMPEESLYGGNQRWMFERDARQESRKKLLAIANELENIND